MIDVLTHPHSPPRRLVRGCLALILAWGAWCPVGAQPAPGTDGGERRVVARGRIEPASRVRTVQAPPGSILGKVYVQEGDRVQAGAILAETNRWDLLTTSVHLEEQRLAEAERGLQRVLAPAKQAEREAQAAAVRQRRAELAQASAEHRRAQVLRGRDLISPEDKENKELALETAQHALSQAEATLTSLSEVREVDVQAAAAQVEVARAALASAHAERDLAAVRAPIDGTVLTLLSREGESPTAEGLLQMADLSRLVVIGEVDQRDVSRVHPGQRAELTGPALPQPVVGQIKRVAHLVYKENHPSSDILIGRDARVVEVEIEPASPLPPVIGGEVDLFIAVP